MDQVDFQGVKYQDDVDCFGDNVIIKRLDGGMLRVKVGRKRSICILRKWDKSRLVYHLKWKQLLRKLVKYIFVSFCC